MDDDARRVQDASQRGASGRGQLVAQLRGEVTRLAAAADRDACPAEHRSRGFDRQRVRGVDVAHELVDRGKIAKLHA